MVKSMPKEANKMAVSESKRAANDRYDSKTYVQFNVRLRIEDDADIIKSISAAHGAGLNNREWLRETFEGSGVQADKTNQRWSKTVYPMSR